MLENWTKHWPTFGALSPRLLGVGMLPKRKLNKRCRKGKAAGLIPRKRKEGLSRPHLKANLITWPGALKSFSEAFKSFSKSFKSFSEALKVGINLIRPLSSHP